MLFKTQLQVSLLWSFSWNPHSGRAAYSFHCVSHEPHTNFFYTEIQLSDYMPVPHWISISQMFYLWDLRIKQCLRHNISSNFEKTETHDWQHEQVLKEGTMIDLFKYIELFMCERNLLSFCVATNIINNNCGYKLREVERWENSIGMILIVWQWKWDSFHWKCWRENDVGRGIDLWWWRERKKHGNKAEGPLQVSRKQQPEHKEKEGNS